MKKNQMLNRVCKFEMFLSESSGTFPIVNNFVNNF